MIKTTMAAVAAITFAFALTGCAPSNSGGTDQAIATPTTNPLCVSESAVNALNYIDELVAQGADDMSGLKGQITAQNALSGAGVEVPLDGGIVGHRTFAQFGETFSPCLSSEAQTLVSQTVDYYIGIGK